MREQTTLYAAATAHLNGWRRHLATHSIPAFVDAVCQAIRSACGSDDGAVAASVHALPTRAVVDAVKGALRSSRLPVSDACVATLASWARHVAYDLDVSLVPRVTNVAEEVVLERSCALLARSAELGVWLPADLRRLWLQQPERSTNLDRLVPVPPFWASGKLQVYLLDARGGYGSATFGAGLGDRPARFQRRLRRLPVFHPQPRFTPAVAVPKAVDGSKKYDVFVMGDHLRRLVGVSAKGVRPLWATVTCADAGWQVRSRVRRQASESSGGADSGSDDDDWLSFESESVTSDRDSSPDGDGGVVRDGVRAKAAGAGAGAGVGAGFGRGLRRTGAPRGVLPSSTASSWTSVRCNADKFTHLLCAPEPIRTEFLDAMMIGHFDGASTALDKAKGAPAAAATPLISAPATCEVLRSARSVSAAAGSLRLKIPGLSRDAAKQVEAEHRGDPLVSMVLLQLVRFYAMCHRGDRTDVGQLDESLSQHAPAVSAPIHVCAAPAAPSRAPARRALFCTALRTPHVSHIAGRAAAHTLSHLLSFLHSDVWRSPSPSIVLFANAEEEQEPLDVYWVLRRFMHTLGRSRHRSVTKLAKGVVCWLSGRLSTPSRPDRGRHSDSGTALRLTAADPLRGLLFMFTCDERAASQLTAVAESKFRMFGWDGGAEEEFSGWWDLVRE